MATVLLNSKKMKATRIAGRSEVVTVKSANRKVRFSTNLGVTAFVRLGKRLVKRRGILVAVRAVMVRACRFILPIGRESDS
jgi:hypothetical protein